MSKTSPEIEALRAAYDAEVPKCERFAERLTEQLNEMLTQRGIALAVPIESRVKSWLSVFEKVDNAPVEKRSLADVGDLIGIRLILLFRRDVGAVLDLLKAQLDIIATEDVSDRLGVTTFGYQSVHLQAQLPKSWLSVPIFSGFHDLEAEIQVRTAAQHIWAAASHVLQYKRADSVPKPVLRSINRVAALLETVDLEFERALTERETYVKGVETAPTKGQETRLNVDLLRTILDEKLPSENRIDNEPYDEILSGLRARGIKSPEALKTLIDKHLEKTLSVQDEIVRSGRVSHEDAGNGQIICRVGGVAYRLPKARLEKGVFWSHGGMIRHMLRGVKQRSRGSRLGTKKRPPSKYIHKEDRMPHNRRRGPGR